ncbi:MAG: hypothetical protein KGP28_04445 [Bdellovibrionales bacterium]|nr:hypothetical protein [Bdellovibrionales bacterium]
MTFGDCNIQPGNSGAPILNEEGELAGIVQGYLSFKKEFDAEAELRAHLLDEAYGFVGIGSQTLCMGELNPEIAPSCQAIPPFTHFSAKGYLDLVGSFDESILPKVPLGEIWSPVPTKSSILKRYFTSPECTKTASFESLEERFRKGINHRLQAEWRRESSGQGKRIPFTLKETDSSGVSSFVAADRSTLELRACR